MPAPDEVLPGRPEAMPVPARHAVLGTPLRPPYPDGTEIAEFGMGCFWGAEKPLLANARRHLDRCRLRRRFDPEPDLRRGVHRPRPGTSRSSASSSIPGASHTASCSSSSGRSTTRPRGSARAATRGRSTARRSSPTARPSSARPRPPRDASRPASQGCRPGHDHHRDPPRPRLLLRRGIPPAIPREEPGRLLRAARHGGFVPGWGAGFRPARVTRQG